MSGGLFSLSQQLLDAYALRVRQRFPILCVDIGDYHACVQGAADEVYDLEPLALVCESWCEPLSNWM